MSFKDKDKTLTNQMKHFICRSILVLLAFGYSSSSNVCGNDWIAFKYGKCFKVFDQLVKFDEAQSYCRDQEAALLSIQSQEEQDYVTHHLSESDHMADSVWLAGKRLNALNTNNVTFIWANGETIVFSHWAEGRPSTDLSRNCVQMSSGFKAVRSSSDHRLPFKSDLSTFQWKWTDVPCFKRNLVICEKGQLWPVSRLQSYLVEAIEKVKVNEKVLNETLEEVKSQERALNETLERILRSEQIINETIKEMRIKDEALNETMAGIRREEELIVSEKQKGLQRDQELLQSTAPLGFIYIELSGQKKPQEMWPTFEWEDVSTLYGGLFFRVLGGDSATFGTIQSSSAPRLTSVQNENGDDCQTDCKIEADGKWSQKIYTTSYPQSSSHRKSLTFKVSGGEVRPQNQAVRVWKRVK